MPKKLKQIDLLTALDYLREEKEVFVTRFTDDKPTLKKLRKVTIGDVIDYEDDLIFQIVEG